MKKLTLAFFALAFIDGEGANVPARYNPVQRKFTLSADPTE